MDTKIKTFKGRLEGIDKKVNEFIKDREVVDIRQSVVVIEDRGDILQVIMVVYKEDYKRKSMARV